MKIFLVYFFISFTILSIGWGKYYLVDTEDAQDEDDDDNDGIENITVDEENIYQYLKGDEIEKFEKLSKKNQTKLITDINTYIANNKNSGGNDYIFGKALARGAGTLFGELL